MGCCLSTPTPNPSDENQHQPMKPRSDMYHVRESKTPPPSSMEEETVKEVLSETPIPKHSEKQEQEADNELKNKTLKLEKNPQQANNIIHKTPEKKKTAPPVSVTEEISELSEICSLSESVSTTFTEKREDIYYESELKQQRVERSPATNKYSKNRSFSGDLTNRQRIVGGSPVRRSDPSPGRMNVGPNSTKDGNFRRRRDPGESSGRRSRSPVTRVESGVNRSGIGRSPSAKRSTGKSPGRVRAAPVQESGKHVENEDEVKWGGQGNNTNNESLENPLVSLECFIFL